MARVITVAVEKGGVGKTASVVNLAALLGKKGHKVLVVDTDQQANATDTLTGEDQLSNAFADRRDAETGKRVVGRCFKEFLGRFASSQGLPAEYFVVHTIAPNVDMIPSNQHTPRAVAYMEAYEEDWGGRKEELLRDALEELRERYDYILIDTAPSLKDLTVLSALVAADYVLVPCTGSQYSKNGAYATLRKIEALRRETNADPIVLGVFMMKVENTSAARYVREVLEEELGELMLRESVRKASVIENSQLMRKPAVLLAPREKACQEMERLLDEILEKIEKVEEA